MFFDIKKKLQELKKKQVKEKEILMEHGVSLDEIEELQRAERRELYGEWKYISRLESYIEPDDGQFRVEASFELGILDEIQDEKLLEALKILTEYERAVVIHHVVDGIPLTMLAAFWNCSYSTIKRRYSRALDKLKKVF